MVPFSQWPPEEECLFSCSLQEKEGDTRGRSVLWSSGKPRAQLSSLHLFSKTKTDLFFAAKKPQAIPGLHEPELWAMS